VVLSAFHSIVVPRDPRTGQPYGKRHHKPFTIVKELDRATPHLHQAMCTNERILFHLQCYRREADGSTQPTLHIALFDAEITRIVLKLPNVYNPKLAHLRAREEVGFVYRRIEWSMTNPPVFGADEWEPR
jgi:type VI secretion system secreted protein Hcp